jgi:chromosome segregation ATPase
MTDPANPSPTLESQEASLLAQRAADNVRFARLQARQDAVEARQDELEARQDAVEARQDELEARQDAVEAEQAVMRADIARLDAEIEAVRRNTVARVEGALQDLLTTLASELSCVLSPQQLARVHDVARARIHQSLSSLQT